MTEKFPMRLERHFAASRRRVFECWTEAAELEGWYRPVADWTTKAETDVRVGGSYRISFGPTGTEYVEAGEYLEVEPDERLSYTMHLEGPNRAIDTVVLVEFAEDGAGTRVVINEDYPSAGERERHEQGWGLFLDHLALLIESSVST